MAVEGMNQRLVTSAVAIDFAAFVSSGSPIYQLSWFANSMTQLH